MLKRLITVVLACLALHAPAEEPAPVRTVPEVDIQRYLGSWYEIAAFPMFFQRQCIADTQARYDLDEKGGIRVHNQCTTSSGIDKAEGWAKVVDGSGNAKLRVSFFWPFWGDYWILALQPDYQWALVGSPTRKYLWLLSRTPSLPAEELQKALEAAKAQQFDISQLRYTPQSAVARAAQ